MKQLCYVATIPAVVHAFLREHIQVAAGQYEVTVICNSADKHLLDGLNARLILLPIERKPSPLRDILVLFQLLNLFRRERFDIVHSIMPKTGMLAMLAAWLARVPIRIHTFTGQVWVTKYGAKRTLLKWFDKLIASFAICVLADSPSQRDFLVSEKVLHPGKVKVIGAGSICGVDQLRFHPDSVTRKVVREELQIGSEQTAILFLGRLNYDKGVPELAKAFSRLALMREDVVLLLVGAEEDFPYAMVQDLCDAYRERLRYVSFTPCPERYMAAADIFCLPSHREGFGQVIIEAGGCGVPTVASRIYGITDAVEDGKTGLLFPPGNIAMLTQHMLKLVENPALCELMGEAARIRARKLFSSQKITEGMLAIYSELLEQN